jgi:hypothetical protein
MLKHALSEAVLECDVAILTVETMVVFKRKERGDIATDVAALS